MTVSDKQLEHIKLMWWDGYSSGCIAETLKLTRNTVMGLINRRDYQRGPQAVHQVRDIDRSRFTGNGKHRRNGTGVKVAPWRPPLRAKSTSSLDEAFIAKSQRCRWPVAEGGEALLQDRLYCSAPAVRGHYCLQHAKLAYIPTRAVHSFSTWRKAGGY